MVEKFNHSNFVDRKYQNGISRTLVYMYEYTTDGSQGILPPIAMRMVYRCER